MGTNNRIFWALVVLILLTSIYVQNVAALVEDKSLNDLTKDSDDIIVGDVISKESYWKDGNIFTNVTVSTNQHIKGKFDNQFVVQIPGGTVGNIYAEVSDVPSFEDNENVLLFLKGNRVVGWNQGKYTINNDTIKENGESMAEFVHNIKQNLSESANYLKSESQNLKIDLKNVNQNLKSRNAERDIDTTSIKLDIKSMTKVPASSYNNNIKSSEDNILTSTVKYEGFEKSFPNNWYIYGNPSWCANNYSSYSGKYSGWNACGGTAGVSAGNLYQNNMNTAMVYGPFSLVGATNPRLKFKHLTNTELGKDYFSYMVSIDGANFYGNTISGDWTPWKSATFELKNVPTLGDVTGQPNMYIAFVFTSDSSVQNYGTFLDEIYLERDAVPTIAPHITNVTPSSGPAKAMELGSAIAASDSTQVTINGSGFGSTKGNVTFWHGGVAQYDATIISWKDTKIVVNVPGRISSYPKPDGTGNVQVFTSDGTQSDNYGSFGVTYSYGGGRWTGNKTVYFVNPNTIDTVDELTAVQAAANTWNEAGTNFGFIYGGTTSKTEITMDGENSIIWVNYDIGAIATTTTWWLESDNKTIIESDIVFNDVINWWADGSQTKMDVQTVATHELGHWLQLLDLYGDIDSKKMMYGYVGNGIIKRTLSMDDISGIKAIYGLTPLDKLDKIAPTTTLIGAVEGVTYSSNVTITLNATDNLGGSGIKNTAYTINDGPMIIYSAPFIVSNIGKNTITYKSIDNNGNVELAKNVSFTINSSENSSDILVYYKGLGQYPNIIETNDLLKAADDWRDNIIPSGLSLSITTNQLLTLADEWRNS